MKLVTFKYQGKQGFGFVIGDRLYEPSKLLPEVCSILTNIENFLKSCEVSLDLIRKCVDFVYQHKNDTDLLEKLSFALGEIAYMPPIPNPPLICGLAGNSTTSWRKQRSRIPDYPVAYLRPISALIGHNEKVAIPKNYGTFRCGAELGVVIKKEAFRIEEEEAMNYVLGYTIVNDMTSDSWKEYLLELYGDNSKIRFSGLLATSYYARSTDSFCPIGPWIVTKDEIPDPYNLLVYSKWNGIEKDRSFSNSMIIGIERTISFLSHMVPLYPGSIIHMGTMGVDGYTVLPEHFCGQNNFMEIEIERIGVLRNYVFLLEK